MFWSNLCKSNWNCAWNLAFISSIYLTRCIEYVWSSSLWIGIFQRATQGTRILYTERGQKPAKRSVCPRSSPLGTFRAEERLRFSDRNSILMTQITVYIINPIVMGFQIQICPLLRVFLSILVKFCAHLPTSFSKTQTLYLEKSIFHKYWLYCSRFFAFTFDLCGLLSFVCHS